jgi:hypothetical protein
MIAATTSGPRIELRPYQREAVDRVYAHLRERDDNPCVVIPTGGGKTPVIATICRDAVGTGTLWRRSSPIALLPGGVVALNAGLFSGSNQEIGLDAIVADPDSWHRVGIEGDGTTWTANGITTRRSRVYYPYQGVVTGETQLASQAPYYSGGYAWYLKDGLSVPAYPAVLAYSIGGSANSILPLFATSLDPGTAACSPRVHSVATSTLTGMERSEAWYYSGQSPTRIPGLTGPLYESVSTSPGQQPTFWGPFDTAQFCDASGRVLGITNLRNRPLNGPTCWDTWFFDGNTTQPAFFAGPGYEYYEFGRLFRQSFASGIANGSAYGTSRRLAPSAASFAAAARGSDAWRAAGGGVTLINLTGTGYEYDNAGTIQRNGLIVACRSNYATGHSARYASNGTVCGVEVWRHDGTSTRLVSLRFGNWQWTNAGTPYRDARAVRLTDQGWVTGTQRRYTTAGADRGQDVWWFNGSTTRRINPEGAPYEWNNAGTLHCYADVVSYPTFSTLTESQLPEAATVGWANRQTATGADRGIDVWLFDGTGTKVISPHTPEFGWNNGGEMFWSASAAASTATGYVAGTATRYTASGSQRGNGLWIYSPVTGQTETWVPPLSASGFSNASVLALTPEGTLIGSYTDYGQGGTQTERLVVCTPGGGFQRLEDLVPGGIEAQGWASLNIVTAIAGPNARYIAGRGTRVGDTFNGSQSFLLALTPPCAADFTGDGTVNTADLTFFLGRFGQPPVNGSPASRADFNFDGAVNTPDLVFFLGRFGSACP